MLEEWLAWLGNMVVRVSAKSEVAGAIGYSSTRWRGVNELPERRIEIDNNLAERVLSGVSLGRKTYLFMGSVQK